MPLCCGVISGEATSFVLTYSPSVNFTSATLTGKFTGVTLTSAANDPLIPLIPNYIIQFPLAVPAPNQLISFDPNVCDYTVCPQSVGNVYTMSTSLTFPTSIVNSAVITVFVAKII